MMLSETDYLIWGFTLGIVLVVIVPLAWSLLNKTLTYTKSINRYSSEMLESGINIANNTESINSMDSTLKSAGNIVEQTQSLKKITKTL